MGGTSPYQDIKKLEAGVHVVVGTLGRVALMLRRRFLRSESIRMVMLDEANRFKYEIYEIFELLPPKLQVELATSHIFSLSLSCPSFHMQ